jgi:lipoprotein-releasing system permease protein
VPFATPSSEHLAEALRTRDGMPSVIIGLELFKRLKLPIGAQVALTTPVGLVGMGNNAARRMELRIGGVFRSGMHEFDVHLVYLEMGVSQRLLGTGDAVHGVELRIAEPQRFEAMGRAVLRAVGGYPYRMRDWRELNRGIFEALSLQKVVFFLVLAFIVVVASFNIASTLFMAVVEKARDIGVMKSMGARDASILKIFVLEGWIVGGIGTLAGVGLGLAVTGIISRLDIAIASDVYMVETLTVRIRPMEIAATVLAALVISHLATLYPALKASRQRPVDAMRYD